MNDLSDGNDPVTRSENGVTVEKSFDSDDSDAPSTQFQAVRFEFHSTRDDAVTVRITDRIPPDYPMTDVGFHSKYESENWTVHDDRRVQFERQIEAEEVVTTAYGVRLTDRQDMRKFLHEPELDVVTPGRADAAGEAEQSKEEHTITDIVSEDGSQVVRDVIAGEGELPGVDDEEAASPDHAGDADGDPSVAVTDDNIEHPVSESGAEADSDLDDSLDKSTTDPVSQSDDVSLEPNDDRVSVADDTTCDSPTDDATIDSTEQSTSPSRPRSVAAALAAEIRAGDVNDTDLQLIQQELSLGSPESTNVRIHHIQSRVDDLAAYTEALEGFIDDNGTTQTIIEEFQTEIETIRSSFDAMHDDIESVKEERARTTARVADLEGELGDFEDRIGTLDADLDVFQSELDDLDDLVATNTHEVTAFADELEGLREDYNDVKSLEGELGSLSTTVSDLSQTMSETDDQIDETIDGLRSDIRDIEGELAEFREWREQLNSVFGGN
ncbi:AAA family ATPase [Haladaptatus sp. NG-SE-30]